MTQGWFKVADGGPRVARDDPRWPKGWSEGGPGLSTGWRPEVARGVVQDGPRWPEGGPRWREVAQGVTKGVAVAARGWPEATTLRAKRNKYMYKAKPIRAPL